MPDYVEQRFDSHVLVAEDGALTNGERCWLWQGARQPGGYAQFQVGGRGGPQAGVHRWNYERFVGPIPNDHQVDHLCKVRHCVNPEHLEAVLGDVNNARSDSPSAKNARMVLCAQDLHELAGDNLEPTALRHGQRRCRACKAEYQRAYRARKRLEGAVR